MAGQNRTGLTPQILRPNTVVNDTFSRPNAGAGLSQLAEGLSTLAPSLTRFSNVLADERNTKDKEAGENAAREFAEAGKTYKQAIDAGLIEKHHSPFFRLGAYETFGRATAFRFAADFKTKLSESPIADSTNPQDFDKFESEQRAKWQKEQLGETVDPHFASAFGTQADNLMNGERLNFASAAGARLVKQAGEAFHAEAFSIIENGHNAHATTAEIVASLELAKARQVAAGMNKSVVNQLLSSAIDAAAYEAKDAELLKVKHEIKLGSGHLAGTSYGSEGTAQTEAKIAAFHQTAATHAEHVEKKRKDEAVDGITRDLVSALTASKSPATVDIRPFMNRVNKEDPDKAATYKGIQAAIADLEYVDIPAVEERLFIGVHTGYTNMSRLDEALSSKSITFQTYSHLANEVQERDKAGKAAGDARIQSAMEKVRRRVSNIFATEYGASTIEQRYRAERAGSEAVVKYLRFLGTDAGKKAGLDGVEEWIHTEVETQFKSKGSPLDVNFLPQDIPQADFSRTPFDSILRPQLVDPKKGPAAPRETLLQIQSDFNTGKYSPPTIAALRALGIQPTREAVQQFLTAQAPFLGANP